MSGDDLCLSPAVEQRVLMYRALGVLAQMELSFGEIFETCNLSHNVRVPMSDALRKVRQTIAELKSEFPPSWRDADGKIRRPR